jgi:hypothetical protein
MKSLLSRLFAAKKPATRKPAVSHRPTLETLEDRTLMSATAPFAEFHLAP